MPDQIGRHVCIPEQREVKEAVPVPLTDGCVDRGQLRCAEGEGVAAGTGVEGGVAPDQDFVSIARETDVGVVGCFWGGDYPDLEGAGSVVVAAGSVKKPKLSLMP